MRPVYFVKYYDKGSTVMAGDQIAEALRARGCEAWSVYPDDVEDVRDAILVFIKTSRWWHLARARRNRNKTVLDVQDTVVFKRRIKNRLWFDGMIWKNRRQTEDFGRPGQLDRVIYHQWDPRYVVNRLPEGELAIGYFGLARSFRLWGRVPGVDCFDGDYFRRALDYNCHLSVREAGREFLYKPNCKVSTAAACAANLITTRDLSTLEFLGEDYPYYTRGASLDAVLEGVEKVRATFGGPEWRDGLERMRAVREATSIERVIDEYLRFFADLG